LEKLKISHYCGLPLMDKLSLGSFTLPKKVTFQIFHSLQGSQNHLVSFLAGCYIYFSSFSHILDFYFFLNLLQGTAFEIVACPITGTMMHLEIQEEKKGHEKHETQQGACHHSRLYY
jgi:hypothetical protein